MNKKIIGLWMYTNESGDVIRGEIVNRLKRKGFEVIYDFDMRECYCLNGNVFTKDNINLSEIDVLYYPRFGS